MKWDRKIRPLEYEIAEREYSEDLEQVAFEATGLFFQVLNAQLALEAIPSYGYFRPTICYRNTTRFFGD